MRSGESCAGTGERVVIHLVTFASDDMSESAHLCTQSAAKHGADLTWRHTPQDIMPTEFYRENRALLDQPRGWGFWAWKPYMILKAMEQSHDYVVYADSGVEFIDNLNFIIDRMDQDIFLFGNQWEHAHWCKRDIIEAIWPITIDEWDRLWGAKTQEQRDSEDPDFADLDRFGKQVQASVIFFRVNDATRAFVKEWLDWCLFEGGRLIDDSPSSTPNHPEFQENRHDQAILTTMAYRDGIKLHAWPAVYNRDLPGGGFVYPREGYPEESYTSLFWHHRKRNHEWAANSVQALADSLTRFQGAVEKASVT